MPITFMVIIFIRKLFAMEELSVEIYVKKHIKYCSGCLHTADVTKLWNMQTYGWVFTDLFTKLYLIDELQNSFICSWCVKRLENARKLFKNFERAQCILAKIADSIMLCNKTQDLKQGLSKEIDDLKIDSRLHYNPNSYNNKNSVYFEPHKSDIKTEYNDSESDIVDNFDYKDESNLQCNLLRSGKVAKDKDTFKKLKHSRPEKKRCRNSKIQSKNEICEYKKHKETLKHEISNSKDISNVKNNTVSSKCASNDLKQESTEEIIPMHTDVDKFDTDEVPLLYIKSQINKDKTDPVKKINTNSKSNNILKPEKTKTKKSREYLPHLPRIPCTECNRLFIKKIALENHMTHNHKKKYPCDKCNKIFTKDEVLKIHIAKVHEPKTGTFECAICATVYKHRVKMVEHMIRHEKYGPSLKDIHSIVCHHCGKVCSRKSIKTHLITHSNEKPYHCTVCNTYFKGALALENHIKRNHNPDIGKQFECPHCPKKFYLSSDVRCHVHAVHFFRNQKCLVCSKSFRTVSKLREHVLRVHEKVPAVRNKQCEYCDKAFSTNRQLKHHRYTHTGEKPYKCDVCNSAYNQKHCLVMHKLRAHNIDKPTKSNAGNKVVEYISNETFTKSHKTHEYSNNEGTWYALANDQSEGTVKYNNMAKNV